MLASVRALISVLALALALFAAGPAFAHDDQAGDSHAADNAHADDQPAGAAHGGDAAHGDDHAQPGVLPKMNEGVAAAITSLIVFLVVLVVLGRFVWPKINAGLAEREERIRSEIRAAEQARQQSKEALEQYEKALQEAKAEARRMLEETKAQQQQLAAQLRSKADVELTQMKDRARRDIDNARKAALAEIYDHVATLATTTAAKILQRELTADDQQRFLDESLAELESTNV